MSETILFIGDIRPLPHSGRPTGIYKHASDIALEIGPEGFIADHQADRRVHGGPEKAVHFYPSDHYARLASRFPEAKTALQPGSMGENISLAGLDESQVHVGETFTLGSACLQLCQPRNPCWKIDERFDCDGMAAFIAEQGLTGWYFRVLTPGLARSGDRLIRLAIPPGAPTLRAAMNLWREFRPSPDALDALVNTPGIAQQWQVKIQQRSTWLRQHPTQTPPAPTSFHVKPQE